MKELSQMVALFAGLTGCAEPEAPLLSYRSTMPVATNGLAVHSGGDRGHAGMYGTNCPFETAQGDVTGDYDLPGSGERAEDAGESELGPETVALTLGEEVYLLEKSSGEYEEITIPWPEIRGVRLYRGGVAGLAGDGSRCAMQWRSDDAVISVEEDVPCDPRFFDVTSEGIAAFGGDTLLLVDKDGGRIEIEETGQLVAADDSLGIVYIARLSGREVAAVGLDGQVLWRYSSRDPIAGLSSAGERGAAVISLQGTSSGAIVWLDGQTGLPLASVETPSAAPELRSSPDGRTLALVLPDEVHFYGVDSPR